MMNNQLCRLIASAIIVAAGGLTLSIGRLAEARFSVRDFDFDERGAGTIAGSIILAVGAILFVREYIKSIERGGKK